MGPLTQCDDIITGRDWNTEKGTQGKHHMKVKAENVVMLPWTREMPAVHRSQGMPSQLLTAGHRCSSQVRTVQQCFSEVSDTLLVLL